MSKEADTTVVIDGREYELVPTFVMNGNVTTDELGAQFFGYTLRLLRFPTSKNSTPHVTGKPKSRNPK